MSALFQHIERVREKPHHVRRKVAFATAFSITAVIAVAWLGFSLSTGVFALKDSSFADRTSAPGAVANPGLAGAAAAVPTDNSAARIHIIDARTSSQDHSAPEETIIPF